MHSDLFQTIKDTLKGQYGGVISAILPGGKIQGNEYVCGSLAGGAGHSCKTNLTTGIGSDFATGQKWGDIIDLAAQAWSKSPVLAAHVLAKQFGIAINNTSPRRMGAISPPTTAKPATEPVGTFTPIMPIPENTPNIPNHPPYSQKYCYRNAKGEELFYVLRYDEPNGKKSIRPLCFGSDRSGQRQWCFKMPKEPRRLYGLDRLAKAPPNAAVLLVEGEKAVDAAQILFPEYVCMTWSGGSNAAALTDYAPIADRTVIIWPDNDTPGLKVALDLIRLIGAVKAEYAEMAGKAELTSELRIILPPENLPPKWDLADPPPSDFDPREFLPHSLTPEKSAPPVFPQKSASLVSASEKRRERIRQLKARLEREESRDSEANRKERNGQLFVWGAMVEGVYRSGDDQERRLLRKWAEKYLTDKRHHQRAEIGFARVEGEKAEGETA